MKLFFFLGFSLTILLGIVVLRKQADAGKDLTNNPFCQKIIFYFPTVIIIFFIGLKFLDPKLYRALVVYEGGVEDLQAINYLLSAVVAGIITRDLIKTRKTLYTILYGIAALGFGFICLEEISWGQRALNLETPEFFMAENTQQEITIHNLEPFQNLINYAYISIGCFALFGRNLVPNKFRQQYPHGLKLFFPDKHLSLYFLPIVLANIWIRYLIQQGETFSGSWQEIPELILSFGFLIFVVQNSLLPASNQNLK